MVRQHPVDIQARIFRQPDRLATGWCLKQSASKQTHDPVVSYCFLAREWDEEPHRPVKADSVLTEFALAALVLLALAIGLAAPIAPVLAQGTSVLSSASDAARARLFEVSGIAVDESGDNTVVAREAAILTAQRRGWFALLERLVPLEERTQVPLPDNAVLGNFIRGFSVAGERTTNERYLAEFTVSFSPDPVSTFLREAGIPFVDTPAPVAVIVPVLINGPQVLLWDDGNVWLEAWQAAPPQSPLSEIKVPLGDIDDVFALAASEALDHSIDAALVIGPRYQADTVVISVLDTNQAVLDAAAPLTVRLISRQLGQEPIYQLASIPPRPTVAERLALAKATTVSLLGESWQARAAGPVVATRTILVEIEPGPRAQWLALRRAMLASGGIVDVALDTLRLDRARLRLEVADDWLTFETTVRELGLEPRDPISGGVLSAFALIPDGQADGPVDAATTGATQAAPAPPAATNRSDGRADMLLARTAR